MQSKQGNRRDRALVDGFLRPDQERGPDLPSVRDLAADVLSLAAPLRADGFNQPGIGQSSSSSMPPADVVFSLRRKGFDFVVAVSALGQGQAGGATAARQAAGFRRRL